MFTAVFQTEINNKKRVKLFSKNNQIDLNEWVYAVNWALLYLRRLEDFKLALLMTFPQQRFENKQRPSNAWKKWNC